MRATEANAMRCPRCGRHDVENCDTDPLDCPLSGALPAPRVDYRALLGKVMSAVEAYELGAAHPRQLAICHHFTAAEMAQLQRLWEELGL